MIGVEQAAPHVGGIDLAGVLDQSEGIGIVAAALLDALLTARIPQGRSGVHPEAVTQFGGHLGVREKQADAHHRLHRPLFCGVGVAGSPPVTAELRGMAAHNVSHRSGDYSVDLGDRGPRVWVWTRGQ